MTYEELYSKFLELQKENSLLREKLGETFQPEITETLETPISEAEITGKVNNQSSPAEKIELFMSLFKGRSDVCAKRYDNKSGKKGYTPYCLNEWKTGLCDKKAARCIECKNKNFLSLDQQVIEEHLTGKKVIGIYPITDNETCYFLAIDFDGDGWIEDIKTVKKICNEFEIPCAIEKSRSGNGGHLWFFFSEEIEATLARKLGTSMLTYSMGFRHEIKFSSYDRLFPNQDTLPQGGLGNLIALPLQKEARRRGNSEFINDEFMSIADQWSFLSNISLISKDELRTFISGLSSGNELGDLKQTDEDDETPWEPRRTQTRLLKKEIPKNFEIIIANQIFIKKAGFSQKALNSLQRLAAFKNPEFYKAQAMRLPTKDKPRVISTSEETNNFLCLPRGCENDLKNLLLENKAKATWRDERNEGIRINVEFNGVLRDEQSQAASSLLQNDNGVLCATTAFGKTVIGAYVISERKVNTLILVHTRELLEQWKNSLTKFLVINEIVPDRLTKMGRKKKQEIIGQLGAGKKQTNGIIDIATMQSLTSDGEIMDFVQDYGMVIVDECHHVSAFSFEKAMFLSYPICLINRLEGMT